jgi:prepilin-type N-terminal cleavage/methylation domain-containing protein
MKIQKRPVRRNGFTLVELITVVSVIVILFGLVAGGYSYADRSAKRSRTEITIKAARSGLETYKEKFGAYPLAANPDTSVAVADKSYVAGGGACLYQALTGDGFDQIDGATGEGAPTSDGNLDDNETANVVMVDMPRELWVSLDGLYFMADGFGHPLRYIKSAPTVAATPGQQPPEPTTINIGTYDIWSYGEDAENITATSLQAADSGSGNRMDAKWIKNW